jgi:hypothetical protein
MVLNIHVTKTRLSETLISQHQSGIRLLALYVCVMLLLAVRPPPMDVEQGFRLRTPVARDALDQKRTSL